MERIQQLGNYISSLLDLSLVPLASTTTTWTDFDSLTDDGPDLLFQYFDFCTFTSLKIQRPYYRSHLQNIE
ncbi:hypothetical protein J6590_041313 [Homalodisca vitripennis]|nr:hypothetical protein J6590_041313 [Homalodisca vitripennis]